MQKKIKRIAIDLSGYGLILLGLLTGWLPGPGGIPLIVAGLGLLSVHNQWAKRILHFIQENGSKFMGWAFPNNKWAAAAHDALVICLLAGALYLIFFARSPITIGLAIGLFALSVVDFLYNRNRLAFFKRK